MGLRPDHEQILSLAFGDPAPLLKELKVKGDKSSVSLRETAPLLKEPKVKVKGGKSSVSLRETAPLLKEPKVKGEGSF